MSHWAKSWQLGISIKKCCTMDIATTNNLTLNYNNKVDNIDIDSVKQIGDLGIIVDSKLTFSAHIAKIVTTAQQRAAVLYRAFITRDSTFLIIAYKSYILPLVEYCSPLWSPHSVRDILLLESVQRCFTKRIPGLQSMSYSARLEVLGLFTLELRRLHCDVIFCYKLLNGHIGGISEAYGLTLSNRSKSRGNSFKLTISYSRIDARKHFFASRIFGPWNSLPDVVVYWIVLQL